MRPLTVEELKLIAGVVGEANRNFERYAKRAGLDPVLTTAAARLIFEAHRDDLSSADRERFEELDIG